MGDIYLSSKDLRSCKPMSFNGYNNGGMIYRYDDGLLMKVYGINSSYLIDTLEYNVDTLLNIGHIENVIMPLCKVYIDGEFKGICMDEVKDATNLYTIIENPKISLNARISYAKQLRYALHNLHQNNVVIGDMHLDNIIVNDQSAYFVDMDSARCKEDILLPSLYYLKQTVSDPYIRIENKDTDNFKLAVIALSMIYQVNFEQPIRDRKIGQYIMDDVRECLPDDLKDSYAYPINMEEYLDKLLHLITTGNYENDRNKILRLKDINRVR